MLNDDGEPIPGLYVAGNDQASVMGGHYPAGGINLGPALTFGYIAGRDLAGPPTMKTTPRNGTAIQKTNARSRSLPHASDNERLMAPTAQRRKTAATRNTVSSRRRGLPNDNLTC